MKLDRIKIVGVLTGLILSGSVLPASAATLIWNTGTGSWFTPGNWMPAGPPMATDDAQIDNGGTAQIFAPAATVNILNLGTFAGTSGTLQVGATGVLTGSGFLGVGNGGNGTLNISAGGVVNNTQGFIAFFPDSVSTATVTGANSKWNNSSTLIIAEQGTATLNVQSGGVVTNTSGTIALHTTATGTVNVSGTNSKWTNSGNLLVGDAGNATLNITGGGMVSNVNGDVANQPGSVGAVTVDGNGSSWMNSGFLDIGVEGTATLDVTNRGLVTNANEAAIGEFGGSGTVTVNGAFSTWTNSAGLDLGEGGLGILNITGGGTVTNTFADIGVFATGVANVDGANSTWTNNGTMTIGSTAEGNGTVNVTNGGVVSSTMGNSSIAEQAGSIGAVNVDGANSMFTTMGGLFVGNGGTGTMNITNGGHVTNAFSHIGRLSGSHGAVTVDGMGSTWTINGTFIVGASGTGRMDVTGGGAVTSHISLIGADPGGDGTVIVDGASSTWGAGNIYIAGDPSGPGGTGLLRIDNGGAVSTGLTTIWDNGTAIVNATLTSPMVTLNGGTLGGNGTVIGDVTNTTGRVSPGDAGAGTLSVTGNYVQQSGADFAAELGGEAEGVESDLLHMTGTAMIDGTAHIIRLDNFMPTQNTRITILRADAGRTGMFADVIPVNWPGLLQPMADYSDPLTVDIIFTLTGTFASEALTPNQRAVAHEVDAVVNDPRAAELIAFLEIEFLGNLPHDYDLIAPEELASIYEIGFSQAVVTNNNLQHRMDDIRAGSNGFCATGYQAHETGGYSKGADGKSTIDKNPTPAFVPSPDNRWGVFVTGSGDFVNVGNDDDNAHGYDITTGNVTVGADYRLGDHFAIGIDGTYSGSTADLVDDGRVEVDGGKAGAYATLYGYKFLGSSIHVDGAVSGGWNSYDTRRTGLEDLPVRGSTNGSEFNALFAYGGDWHFGCLLLGTWSSVQYTNVNIDSFTETGSLAPLHIENQDEYSLRGTTGVRLAYDLKAGSAIVRPEVRAAWQHESGDRAYPIDARFASGAGDVFRVHGPAIGRDSALVDAGIAVQWSRSCSVYVYYDGVLGRSNYDNHAVSAGVRFGF